MKKNIFLILKKFFFRKKLTLFTKKDKIILFIASFMPQKNHRFLIDVLKFLPDNYKLILGGPHQSKSEQREFKKTLNLIKKKKFQKRVQIIDGFVSNFNEYLWASDVMAFPVSKDEGFGTPVVESQACGVPVVSNKIKNLTERYIIQGQGGYSTNLNSKNFANKIKKSQKIKKKILEINSKNFLKTISTNIIDQKYYNLISMLINEKSSSSY